MRLIDKLHFLKEKKIANCFCVSSVTDHHASLPKVKFFDRIKLSLRTNARPR